MTSCRSSKRGGAAAIERRHAQQACLADRIMVAMLAGIFGGIVGAARPCWSMTESCQRIYGWRLPKSLCEAQPTPRPGRRWAKSLGTGRALLTVSIGSPRAHARQRRARRPPCRDNEPGRARCFVWHRLRRRRPGQAAAEGGGEIGHIFSAKETRSAALAVHRRRTWFRHQRGNRGSIATSISSCRLSNGIATGFPRKFAQRIGKLQARQAAIFSG